MFIMYVITLSTRNLILFGITSILELTGLVSGEVVLSPSSPVLTESNSLTFTCTYTGEETLISFTWKRIKQNEIAFSNIGLINANCSAIILPINNSVYQYDCPSSKQYTWTIKNVTRLNEGEKYQCVVDTPSPGVINSNEVIIAVQVPITFVKVISPSTQDITVKENTETEFICKTSGGLPEAIITWYKSKYTSSQTGNEVVINAVTNSSYVIVNGLREVSSVLKYSPSRNDNGWRIYCKAENIVGLKHVSDEKPQLNVQYPPGFPMISYPSDSGEYRVIENTQGQLTCSVSGGNPVPTLSWDCYNEGTLVGNSEGIVTKNLTWTAERGKDKTCTCHSFHYSGIKSVSIKIQILYPPTVPTFQIHGTTVSGGIKVIRNNSLLVNCNSSAYPQPSYTWTYSNNIKRNGQVLNVTNVQRDKRYTCNVQNMMKPTVGQYMTGKNSLNIDVQMLYAPSTPTFHYWNTSGQSIPTGSLDVIKEDTFKVACTSTGEPSPAYNWDNFGKNSILTITRIGTDKTSSICKATNTMKETVGQILTKSATAVLAINVQYPPSAVTLTYWNRDILTTTLKVREGKPFNISCSSDSNPPSSFNWTGTTSSTSSILNVDKALKKHAGKITCYVANVMTRSFANPEKQITSATSKSLDLQILYPPTIGDLQNVSVIEGSQLDVLCPISVGNPPVTIYAWLREGNVWKTSQHLTIGNVTRTDAMFYTCKVSNTMEATGQKPVTVDVTKSFYLNVWYRATVKKFFVKGHDGKTNVVRNENDKIEFKCELDSNPGSNMYVVYMEIDLEAKADVKQLTHVIDSATCTMKGDYKCVGFNQYNEKHSYQMIHLFINCSPRPSPFSVVREKVTSAQHLPAVLIFNALAYPETTLEFKWYRLFNNVWHHVSSNEEFQVNTVNLQSNLTVKYVNRTYYGTYQLKVKNTIGIYSQLFFLEPEDIPEIPKDFIHLSEELKASSVTIQWTPGFDNGPRQTFILRYKKSSDSDWTDIEIPDTGEDKMNYTVDSLSSGTQYDFVLYSRNKLGKSNQTNLLKIRTEGQNDCHCCNESTPAVIVGLISSIIIILLSIYSGYISIQLRRIKTGKDGSDKELASSEENGTPTYINLSYSPKENRHLNCTDIDKSISDSSEYMALDDKLRENKETYDVLNSKH